MAAAGLPLAKMVPVASHLSWSGSGATLPTPCDVRCSCVLGRHGLAPTVVRGSVKYPVMERDPISISFCQWPSHLVKVRPLWNQHGPILHFFVSDHCLWPENKTTAESTWSIRIWSSGEGWFRKRINMIEIVTAYRVLTDHCNKLLF